jgi:hypothetical protein
MNSSLPENLKSKLSSYIASSRTNSFTQAMNNGLLYIMIIVLGLLALGIVLSVFILNSVFPFHVLSKIEHSDAVLDAIGSRSDAHTFTLAVKGLIITIGLLLMGIARAIYLQIGLRNEVVKANKLLQEIDQATQVHKNLMTDKDKFQVVEPKDLELPERKV